MPFQDGTGPQGQGSRTGRGQGNCAGQGGTGRGRGRGLGDSANQGNSWVKNLQAALEKLTKRLDKTNKD